MINKEKTVIKNVDAFALIQAIALAQEEERGEKDKNGKQETG